jgi:hypothetical protein
MTTDQKVLGLNPNAVTNESQKVTFIRNLFAFYHSVTFPSQTINKGLFYRVEKFKKVGF